VSASVSCSNLDVCLRVLAALAGTLPLALFASAALARFLPLSEDTRFAIGFTLAIPLWITAMSFAFLARSAARAWAACLTATAVFAALVYGVPQ
jgi:hypothetical protein